MLLQQLLGEVDIVKSLEGVLLVVRVETSVPDFVQFVPQIDDELLDVGFLQFLVQRAYVLDHLHVSLLLGLHLVFHYLEDVGSAREVSRAQGEPFSVLARNLSNIGKFYYIWSDFIL